MFILKPLRYLRTHPVLIFPAVVLLLLLAATGLRVNGSSIGIYGYLLDDKPSQGLLAGMPRAVRSDEWMVNTPFVVAQTENNFNVFNDNIGRGQDMSVVLDVPYLDWSILFRPQNLSFFVLPLEFAFAFKWWFLAAILLVSVYCIILLFYPRRYLTASLLSLAFFFSPFIQWWYQSITILPIAYGLLAVILAYRILATNSMRSTLLHGAGLAYILVCFSLVMYPAFQITAAISAIGLFFAIILGREKFYILKQKRLLITYLGIIFVTGTIVAGFLLQHGDVISSIQHTVYPGERNVGSGGYDPWMLLLWPFSYLLLDGGPLTVFGGNQSENSTFLLFGISSLVLLLVIKSRFIALSRVEKNLLGVIGVLCTIIAIRLFIPYGSEIFTVFGLHKVPHERLMPAIGIVSIMSLALVVNRNEPGKLAAWRKDKAVLFAPLVLFFIFTGAWLIDRHFVINSVGSKEILAIALSLTAITTLLLHRHTRTRVVGLAGVVIFSFISTAPINPLFIGLPSLTSTFTSAVKALEDDDNRYWASDDSSIISALLVSAGAEVVGGVNTYPQRVWSNAFPEQTNITNRYAHIRIDFSESYDKPYLSLLQADSFKVSLSSCDPFVHQLKIYYIVSDTAAEMPCFKPIKTVTSGQKTVTIFEYR